MELVEGPTLTERIATGALPPNEALSIAKQIAEALEGSNCGPTVVSGWSRRLIAAQESKRPPFLFVQDVAGGAPRRLVEGAAAGAVSPDGRIVASMGAAGSIVLTPVDGSQSRTLTGVPIGASISRWEASGRYVFLKASGEFGVNVFRVDVATGHAEAWRTLAPSDVAGVRYPTYSLAMTPDGQSYCYSYGRRLSTLFVVNGLK